MKILHLDARPDWRGGQYQIFLTLLGQRARGHSVELLALRDSPLSRRAGREGFTVHPVARGGARLVAALRLRKILASGKFDVVHAHDPHALTAAWLGGAHRRAALVASRRVIFPISSSRIALARYRASRRILAVSRFVAGRVIAAGIKPERVGVVYDGAELPVPVTPEMRWQARARWGVGDREPLLGCVSQLLPSKGQQALLRALPAVVEKFPGCRLLLAGAGPSRRNLEKLARELGLQASLIFAGFVEEIESVYQAINLFLFPAVDEALGTSLLQAMSHSLPVIAVASGGVPELVQNELNGLLVKSQDSGQILRAILCLLEDRVMAARLGQAACATVSAKFTAEQMVEATLAEYKKALAQSS